MINSIYVADCDTCNGKGVVFFGDNEDYHIDPCECVANG
jgi:hypothetical protein